MDQLKLVGILIGLRPNSGSMGFVVGPVNGIWNPLNSAIPVKIWIVKEVVGPVHSAWDPLADTPT